MNDYQHVPRYGPFIDHEQHTWWYDADNYTRGVSYHPITPEQLHRQDQQRQIIDAVTKRTNQHGTH